MKKIMLLLLLALWGLNAIAQTFAPRILSFSRQKVSYVTLLDGTEIEGNVRGAKFKKGLMKQITIADTVTGDKQKISAEDIATMRLAPSDLGKFAAASEATSSVAEMTRNDGVDWTDALKRDFVYFERAQLDDRKGTFVLLQLVNPGFESQMKVFDDPRASETMGLGVGGVRMTGGFLKSYYIVRDGKAVKVAKKDYEKEFFPQFFGDCPAVMEAFGDDIDWKDFAAHVYLYEQKCE